MADPCASLLIRYRKRIICMIAAPKVCTHDELVRKRKQDLLARPYMSKQQGRALLCDRIPVSGDRIHPNRQFFKDIQKHPDRVE